MRYRLYSRRLGLNGSTITRIFSLSITTNWLGYILLGGDIHGRSGEAAAALVHQPDHSAHYRRGDADPYALLSAWLRVR